jgi:drug/metabolite transporter (DMT)-like permease
VIAIIALFAGLERLGAPVSSVVSTIEPVITIALAWLFLQERMGAVQLLGGAVIVIAAALFARQPRTAAS